MRRTYTATFQDGDVSTRTTSRDVSHGWRVRHRDGAVYGFAPSATEAHKAAKRASRDNEHLNVTGYEVAGASASPFIPHRSSK